MKEWYKKHLDLPVGDWGATFGWPDKDKPDRMCYTAWSPFPSDTLYFGPSEKEFMLNFRVRNLEILLEVLAGEGVEIVGEMEEYDYGKFGWILDPEGNKIELWEPKDEKPGIEP